jgi:hypothetical protein
MLKIGDDHFDIWKAREIGPRKSRELGAQLERGYLVAAQGEVRGRLSRPTSDLQYPAAASQSSEPLDVDEDLGKVMRTDAVVALGLVVEGLPQRAVVALRHAAAYAVIGAVVVIGSF